MKAILVIDVPEDDIGKEASVMYLGNDSWLRSIEFIPIKPMPKKEEVSDDSYVADYLDFDLGWNACIEELEK